MKVLFYPDKLRHHNKLRYVFDYLGVEWTNEIKDNWDIAIFWDFNTVRKKPVELEKYKRPILNFNCTTASKDHINTVFYNVFGYTSVVNPIHFKGYCVEKSINQAAHDGKIVKCPLYPKENYVYQKIIDTRIDEKYIKDIRVPIFKNEIACIFEKIRPINQLYGGINRRGNKIIYHKNPNDILYDYEQVLLIEFCKFIPVEYCELDVLRSNWDNRIYVVDMNNTPSGGLFLTMGLDKKETKKAIEEYSEIFYKTFLK